MNTNTQPTANASTQAAYTACAPATNNTPPSAGPPMMAACVPAELNARPRASSCDGNRFGVNDCIAGIWKARAIPSATDTPSSSPRETQAASAPNPTVDATSSAATSACATMQVATMRPR